ncbi:MAG: cytochrome-c oxidase [Nitrospirota bacterium]
MKDRIGINLLKIAALYMLAGLASGMFMAISKDHTLAGAHSHITLLGWTTMAITGVIYIVVPACANNKLAGVHFWLHNIGLPLMICSLALFEYGNAAAEKFIGIGSTTVLISLLVFTINVVKTGRAKRDTLEHNLSAGEYSKV